MIGIILIKWRGVFSIIIGIYLLLVAFRVISLPSKNLEKKKIWHQKFGFLIKILSPFIIVLGIVQLLIEFI